MGKQTKISRKRFLKEDLDMQKRNLMSYSADINMTKPKLGYEKEWNETLLYIALTSQLLDEAPDDRGVCIFVGKVKDKIQTKKGICIKFTVTASMVYYFMVSCLDKIEVSDEVVKIKVKNGKVIDCCKLHEEYK